MGRTLGSKDRFDGTSWEVSIVCLASYVAHWDGSRVFKCLIVRSLIHSTLFIEYLLCILDIRGTIVNKRDLSRNVQVVFGENNKQIYRYVINVK